MNIGSLLPVNFTGVAKSQQQSKPHVLPALQTDTVQFSGRRSDLNRGVDVCRSLQRLSESAGDRALSKKELVSPNQSLERVITFFENYEGSFKVTNKFRHVNKADAPAGLRSGYRIEKASFKRKWINDEMTMDLYRYKQERGDAPYRYRLVLDANNPLWNENPSLWSKPDSLEVAIDVSHMENNPYYTGVRVHDDADNNSVSIYMPEDGEKSYSSTNQKSRMINFEQLNLSHGVSSHPARVQNFFAETDRLAMRLDRFAKELADKAI